MTDSLPSAAIFVSSRSFLSRLLLAWRDENGCEGDYMAVRQQSYLATMKYEFQYFILRPIKNINLIFLFTYKRKVNGLSPVNKHFREDKFSHGSKVHQKNNRGPANMSEKNKKKVTCMTFGCVWLHSGTKWQPIRFYNRSTIHVAVSAKKDCWDSGILLPSWRGVTLLFIDSALFPVTPGANLMRTHTTSREESGRSAGSVIRSSRYHDEPNSGFIQNLQQFFKDFWRTTLDFQGPPTRNIPSLL